VSRVEALCGTSGITPIGEPATTVGDVTRTLDSNDPVARVRLSRSDFVDAYGSGDYKGEPIQLAAGKYARPGEIIDVKPYHEGVNPFIEHSDQVSLYREAHYNIFRVYPKFRFVLYEFV